MAVQLSNENHARLLWSLAAILYCIVGMRYWALRRIKYKLLSPRGISSAFILLTVGMITLLCAMVTWSLVGPERAIVDKAFEDLNTGVGNITTGDLANADDQGNAAAGNGTSSIDLGDILGGSGIPSGVVQTLDEIPSGVSVLDLRPTNQAGASVGSVGELPSGVAISSANAEDLASITAAAAAAATTSPAAAAKRAESTDAKATETSSTVAALASIIYAVGGTETDDKSSAASDLLSSTEAQESSIAAQIAAYEAAGAFGDVNVTDALAKGDVKFRTSDANVTATAPGFEKAWKVNLASMTIFYTCLWLVKFSFIVIYFEFSADLSSRTRKFLYATSGCIAISYIFVLLVHLLWCLPMEENYKYEILTANNAPVCRASLAPSVINSSINIMTDLLIMCAGVAIIRSLNLGRSDFKAASLIIGIGMLTILTALVRLICLIVWMVRENKNLNASVSAEHADDHITTYSFPVQESVAGYPEVEAILAGMATCLPALRVLFRTSTGRTTNGKSNPPTYQTQTQASSAGESTKDLLPQILKEKELGV